MCKVLRKLLFANSQKKYKVLSGCLFSYLTLKKPMTATSLSAMRDSACVTSLRVAVAGPVLFFNQLTMSSAWRPAIGAWGWDSRSHEQTDEFCTSEHPQDVNQTTQQKVFKPPAGSDAEQKSLFTQSRGLSFILVYKKWKLFLLGSVWMHSDNNKTTVCGKQDDGRLCMPQSLWTGWGGNWAGENKKKLTWESMAIKWPGMRVVYVQRVKESTNNWKCLAQVMNLKKNSKNIKKITQISLKQNTL